MAFKDDDGFNSSNHPTGIQFAIAGKSIKCKKQALMVKFKVGLERNVATAASKQVIDGVWKRQTFVIRKWIFESRGDLWLVGCHDLLASSGRGSKMDQATTLHTQQNEAGQEKRKHGKLQTNINKNSLLPSQKNEEGEGEGEEDPFLDRL